MKQATLRLLSSVEYHGLGYVEFKRDARSGELFLIESNVGRATGRSAIVEAGGVEICETLCCELADLPLPSERQQTFRGVRWIYLRHDLQAAFVAWKNGELGFRTWCHTVLGPKTYAVWSPRDPLPFLFDIARAFAAGVRALDRRRPRRAQHTETPPAKAA